MTTWQKGLYMYDPSVGETTVFKKDDLAYSYVLHQDSDTDIWVGTWGRGLLRLAEDFCTSSGYVKYDTATADGETLLDEVIYAINDVDGYILVGGQKGFSIIDRESEDTRFFAPGTSDSSLPYNQVNTILVTANGNVYLGLYGGGMCSVADKVIPYAVDPLSEIRRRFGTNTVHGIFASDSSWIWMGIPDNGFVLYDPVSHKVLTHSPSRNETVQEKYASEHTAKACGFMMLQPVRSGRSLPRLVRRCTTTISSRLKTTRWVICG